MLLYEDETGKIIRACMNVFNELGNGFLEAVYQEALAIEFQLMKIPFVRESKIEIFYKGNKLNKEYHADFICFENVIVELKCVSKLIYIMSYFVNTKKSTGLRGISYTACLYSSSLRWKDSYISSGTL